MNPKAKGGAHERAIAKQLSVWFFNDNTTLRRHPSSGADKAIQYRGDVIPFKQIPFTWRFYIECKKGYGKFLPDFWNYDLIEKWYIKAYNDGCCTGQCIVVLITQFPYKKPLWITNLQFPPNLIQFNLCFPLEVNKREHYIFVYDMKKLLETTPQNLFNFEEICKPDFAII